MTWRPIPYSNLKSSIYADLYSRKGFRARRTPRTGRTYRTKNLAWEGIRAFYRNRFYERDRFYKARIYKPPQYPNMKLIDAENYSRSLAERLQELSLVEMAGREPVDIGLPFQKEELTEKMRRELRRRNTKLESAARHRTLVVDLNELEKAQASKSNTDWIEQKMQLAHHHGIFRDLFHQDAYFYPVVNMDIEYLNQTANNESENQKDENLASDENVSEDTETAFEAAPVYHGNSIQPSEAMEPPVVKFSLPEHLNKPENYWTLLMTNPDGNPWHSDKEIIHWMISNIPSSGDLSEGDVICDYLQPLPFFGTGFHRVAFVLFLQHGGKQTELCKDIKLTLPCDDLEARTFSTPKFYKENEKLITPVGLAYFQSQWDKSVRDTMHQRLDLPHPIYKFEFPEPVYPEQEEFPSKPMPFHLYMDQYRSPENVEEEILRKRLKRVGPFDKEPRNLKYPNIFWYQEKHSMEAWRHVEKQKENLGLGKYKGIYKNAIE